MWPGDTEIRTVPLQEKFAYCCLKTLFCIIPALWAAEAGSQFLAQPGQVTDLTRPCLNKKLKKRTGD